MSAEGILSVEIHLKIRIPIASNFQNRGNNSSRGAVAALQNEQC